MPFTLFIKGQAFTRTKSETQIFDDLPGKEKRKPGFFVKLGLREEMR